MDQQTKNLIQIATGKPNVQANEPEESIAPRELTSDDASDKEGKKGKKDKS